MKNKTYMASSMHRIDKKDIRKSEEELKGRCQLKEQGVVWRVILNIKVETVTFLRQAVKFMGRPEHSPMAPVVAHTNVAV